MKGKCFILILLFAGFSSCNHQDDRELLSSNNDDKETNVIPACNETGAWGVDSKNVYDGGVGKDGIISIDNPKFISVEEAEYAFR